MASPTNFFENQDRAKRRTALLVVLFTLAVAVIMAMSYLVVAMVYLYFDRSALHQGGTIVNALWQPRLLGPVAAGVLLVVLGGSSYKLAQLRGGGSKVAEMLGGRLVDTASQDPRQRQLLNVVEEMAIASGTPVPPVYLMEDDQAINAFAAGFEPDDAVIGVTRGTVDLLTRDQLQGVIAHEFSHILNGDMRTNLRLTGVLHGILVIGLIGGVVLRGAFYSGGGRSRSSGGNKKGGAGILIILGGAVALLVIGYAGVFFGKLIKAAVSRQREFLADAAAVQFTRYPQGIGGALQTIGGYEFGSKVRAANAEEFSHMYFAEGISSAFGRALASHPPLPERIRRVLPDWDGTFPEVDPSERAQIKIAKREARLSRGPAREAAANRLAALTAAAAGASDDAPGQGGEASGAVDRIGRPSSEHLAYADQLMQSLPEAVRESAREGYGARAVVYALLLDDSDKVARQQLSHLWQHAGRDMHNLANRLHGPIAKMNPAARLPLIDLCLSSLRRLSPKQHETFLANVKALIQADRRTDLFEWMLLRVLDRRLTPQAKPSAQGRPRYHSLKPLAEPSGLLLATLAYAGHNSAERAAKAYRAAVGELGLKVPPEMPPRDGCTLQGLGEALGELDTVAMQQKKKLLQAAAVCIAHDRTVSVREGELLRAISDSLGCPMPPLLPGQPLV